MECPWCKRDVDNLYEVEYGHDNDEVCLDCYFENIDLHEELLKGGDYENSKTKNK
jgi:hypothetical protein